MYILFTYVAYSWLIFSGIMHVLIDVIFQYFRRIRISSTETNLYWGLNIAYGLGQIVLGLFAIFIARYNIGVLRQWPVIIISLLSGISWLIFSIFFIEYREPKIIISIFIVFYIIAIFFR